MALCQRVSQLILFILPPHFEKLRKKIKKMLILDFSFSSQKIRVNKTQIVGKLVMGRALKSQARAGLKL